MVKEPDPCCLFGAYVLGGEHEFFGFGLPDEVDRSAGIWPTSAGGTPNCECSLATRMSQYIPRINPPPTPLPVYFRDRRRVTVKRRAVDSVEQLLAVDLGRVVRFGRTGVLGDVRARRKGILAGKYACIDAPIESDSGERPLEVEHDRVVRDMVFCGETRSRRRLP